MIKKRLQRAKKTIINKGIKFEIPQGKDLIQRLDRVIEVIYVLFNEGFHSIKKEILIRKELCGEALRLCKMLLKKETLRSPKVYALFALMCFHSSRIDGKIDAKGQLIDLKLQDRTKWSFPLISLGNDAMNKAVAHNDPLSSYHYEAAIAFEHLKAPSFERTDWNAILRLYEGLHSLQPSSNSLLNMAIVNLQLNQNENAIHLLDQIEELSLSSRNYLRLGAYAEYYYQIGDNIQAIHYLSKAIASTNNQLEKNYLENKMKLYTNSN